MSLIEQIKHNQVAARKGYVADVAILLTTVIGEAERIGKDKGNRAPTDEEVVTVIKKFITNINDTLAVLPNHGAAYDKMNHEKNILMPYLPKQLSETELNGLCATIAGEVGKDKGALMKAFKTRFSGQYDGKLLASVVDNFLKG